MIYFPEVHMKYQLSSLVLFLATLLFLGTKPVSAATICQPIYGGGQTCVTSGTILIEKKVSTPTNAGMFVDNLGVNDAKFAPDQSINFLISITNTGGSPISKVTVRDYFPAEVTFVAGAGSYDAKTKTLSFDLTNVAAGETRTFIVTTKAVGADQLPANKTIVCDIVNKAVAIVDGQVEDTARFCIQKPAVVTTTPGTTKGGLKIFPPAQVTTTPPTGPEALALFGLVPTGMLGYFLRKKAQG